MKIALVYCHPAVNQPKYGPAARLFTTSYMASPPGETDHELWVCLNGGNGHGPYQEKLFAPLPVNWFEHDNWAKDIGAFEKAAETIPCDLLVCFGAHIHFHRAGWLDRMVQAFDENGPALYGAWGLGAPRPHIRTTAFWAPPELIQAYPFSVSDRTRYEYEHGANSLTLWAQRSGFETLMVTFSEVLPMNRWRHAGCGDCLFGDQHTKCL